MRRSISSDPSSIKVNISLIFMGWFSKSHKRSTYIERSAGLAARSNWNPYSWLKWPWISSSREPKLRRHLALLKIDRTDRLNRQTARPSLAVDQNTSLLILNTVSNLPIMQSNTNQLVNKFFMKCSNEKFINSHTSNAYNFTFIRLYKQFLLLLLMLIRDSLSYRDLTSFAFLLGLYNSYQNSRFANRS